MKCVYGYMVMVGEGLYCLVSSFHPVIKHEIIAPPIHCQLYARLKAVVREDFFLQFHKYPKYLDFTQLH